MSYPCDKCDRAMQRAADAERQRQKAWTDRAAAALELHDRGLGIDDDKLARLGAELATERQRAHVLEQRAVKYRRAVAALVAETEDTLGMDVDAARVLAALLRSLGKLNRAHQKELAS